ncbi:hypothetical protein CCMA1212_007169 [Trichoderma ghanense]|uniref:Secreted protein n=1 Tax=Trichoderma ghanense TaxID=65468 RepID=A0ABY2GYD5_9HYPO
MLVLMLMPVLMLLPHPIFSSSMLDSIAHPSSAAVLVLADAGKLKGSYITAACYWQLGGRSHRGRRRCSSIAQQRRPQRSHNLGVHPLKRQPFEQWSKAALGRRRPGRL